MRHFRAFMASPSSRRWASICGRLGTQADKGTMSTSDLHANLIAIASQAIFDLPRPPSSAVLLAVPANLMHRVIPIVKGFEAQDELSSYVGHSCHSLGRAIGSAGSSLSSSRVSKLNNIKKQRNEAAHRGFGKVYPTSSRRSPSTSSRSTSAVLGNSSAHVHVPAGYSRDLVQETETSFFDIYDYADALDVTPNSCAKSYNLTNYPSLPMPKQVSATPFAPTASCAAPRKVVREPLVLTDSLPTVAVPCTILYSGEGFTEYYKRLVERT